MIKLIPPCLEFYTDKFIPAHSSAVTCGPVVFYRPKYREDKGMISSAGYAGQVVAGCLGF